MASISTPITPALTEAINEAHRAWVLASGESDQSAYQETYRVLSGLLAVAFGPEDGVRVYDVMLDGEALAYALTYLTRKDRDDAHADYFHATLVQAEEDALAAFDAVAAGEGDPAGHLRTFAGATGHLHRYGMVLAVDTDTADQTALLAPLALAR